MSRRIPAWFTANSVLRSRAPRISATLPWERRNESVYRHPSSGEGTYRRNLVSDYTHRSLSKTHIKLRAISALAKFFRENIQREKGVSDEYVAGLWKGELPEDPTSAVTDGSIVLQGAFVPVPLVFGETRWKVH